MSAATQTIQGEKSLQRVQENKNLVWYSGTSDEKEARELWDVEVTEESEGEAKKERKGNVDRWIDILRTD